MTEAMTPSKPYLLRALYEWIVDNNCTPHVIIKSTYPGVTVPQAYVKDGQIVLNVSPSAVVGLVMSNDSLDFSARFGGQPFKITAPISAVLAIYARENGQGMFFGEEEPPPPEPHQPESSDSKGKELDKAKRPALKVVK